MEDRRDIFLAFSFFCLLVALVLILPSFQVKPNLFIVIPLVGAFFIRSWYVYLVFLLGQIFWFKYVPHFELEYLYLFVFGMVAFFSVRFFIFRRNFISVLLLLLVFQIFFWFLTDGGSAILSILFVREFLYNGIIAGAALAIGTWQEKKFF